MTSAGSPGSSCCSEKIRIDTKNSVGTSWTIRRARKFSMRCIPYEGDPDQNRCQPSSLQLQPDYAHESVGHLLVTLELVGVRDQDAAMIEVKDGLVVQLELGQLLIDCLALGHVGHQPRVV